MFEDPHPQTLPYSKPCALQRSIELPASGVQRGRALIVSAGMHTGLRHGKMFPWLRPEKILSTRAPELRSPPHGIVKPYRLHTINERRQQCRFSSLTCCVRTVRPFPSSIDFTELPFVNAFMGRDLSEVLPSPSTAVEPAALDASKTGLGSQRGAMKEKSGSWFMRG